jgi:hypothetical protein
LTIFVHAEALEAFRTFFDSLSKLETRNWKLETASARYAAVSSMRAIAVARALR